MTDTLSHIQAAELDLDLTGTLYPDLVEAHDYWQRLRGNRFAPRRQEVDPADIPKLLPRVMLAEVEHRGEAEVDFRFRLSGTGICRVHGMDLKGLLARELEPRAFGHLVHSHYEEALSRRAPMVHALAMQSHDAYFSYARIILPLSDDGSRIDQLLVVDSEKQNSLHEFLQVIEAVGDQPGSAL